MDEKGKSEMMHSLWRKNKVKRSKHARYNHASIARGRRRIRELPNEDLLEEIMLKLPVKTLIRFQTVSKQWKRMITSKAFREIYMLHVKTKGPKFLSAYKDRTRYKPTIDLNTVRLDWSSNSLVEEENYKIIDEVEDEVGMVSNSLDGLFCIHGSSFSRQIKVVNPATKCSYKIPLAEVQRRRRCYSRTKYNFPPLGFGKDYVTGTYKLVWLHSLFNNTLSCEVFDFGVKQWRNVNSPPPFHHGLENKKLPTFANGWMYWLHQDKTKLIAFDLHMEVFKVIPNPIIKEESSSPSSIYKEIRIDSTDGHHFVWFSLSTYGDDRMQHVWKLTNHNNGGALSIVKKIFSFNYYNITSTGVVPKLFEIQPISKNANKFLLSGRNHLHHLFLVDQPALNSTPFSPPLVPSDFPFSQNQITLVPFFPSLVSPF